MRNVACYIREFVDIMFPSRYKNHLEEEIQKLEKEKLVLLNKIDRLELIVIPNLNLTPKQKPTQTFTREDYTPKKSWQEINQEWAQLQAKEIEDEKKLMASEKGN